MSKREQHLGLWERFHDQQPDGYDGQHKRKEPAPARRVGVGLDIPKTVAARVRRLRSEFDVHY